MPGNPGTFRPGHLPSKAAERRAADERRGSARERGYTTRWDREAAAFKRAHPLCLGCQAIGRIEPTTVVDHVEPHKGDQAKFWNRDRWQPSCGFHHDQVKKRLEELYERGLVTIADLWLDSAAAVALTRDLRG